MCSHGNLSSFLFFKMGGSDSKPIITYRDEYQKSITLSKYENTLLSELTSKSAGKSNKIPTSNFLFPTVGPEFDIEMIDNATGELVKSRYLQDLEECCTTQVENPTFSCDPLSKEDTSSTCEQFFHKNCIDTNSDSNYCNKTLERIVALSSDYQYASILSDYYQKYKNDINKMRTLLKLMRTKSSHNNKLNQMADEILQELHKNGLELKCAMNTSDKSVCTRPECVLEYYEFLSTSNIQELEACKNTLCINTITFEKEERDANVNSMCYVELDTKMLRNDFTEGYQLPFRVLPLHFFLSSFLLVVLFQSLNG